MYYQFTHVEMNFKRNEKCIMILNLKNYNAIVSENLSISMLNYISYIQAYMYEPQGFGT